MLILFVVTAVICVLFLCIVVHIAHYMCMYIECHKIVDEYKNRVYYIWMSIHISLSILFSVPSFFRKWKGVNGQCVCESRVVFYVAGNQRRTPSIQMIPNISYARRSTTKYSECDKMISKNITINRNRSQKFFFWAGFWFS